MKLPISQEQGPIGRKCEHCASFLSTRNLLFNARENPFPGGYVFLVRSSQSETFKNGHKINTGIFYRENANFFPINELYEIFKNYYIKLK